MAYDQLEKKKERASVSGSEFGHGQMEKEKEGIKLVVNIVSHGATKCHPGNRTSSREPSGRHKQLIYF
jgi:hypothetical protein